jgi:hypothetical protein
MGFFLTFVDFILKKGNHVCLKENAVPICPDSELSFSTVPNCLVSILTRLLLIMYNNTSLACLLQASNDVHCS